MATLIAIATKTRLNQCFLPHLFAQLNEKLFDSYRPEMHYMRGPGPKWRQKHGHVNAKQRLSLNNAQSVACTEHPS